MNLISWIPILKLLPVAFVVGIGAQIAASVLNLSGDKADLAAQVRSLEGRYAGAIVRIERRDAAINALPASCKAQALGWVKNGDAPTPFNPFSTDVQRSGQ